MAKRRCKLERIGARIELEAALKELFLTVADICDGDDNKKLPEPYRTLLEKNYLEVLDTPLGGKWYTEATQWRNKCLGD